MPTVPSVAVAVGQAAGQRGGEQLALTGALLLDQGGIVEAGRAEHFTLTQRRQRSRDHVVRLEAGHSAANRSGRGVVADNPAEKASIEATLWRRR